MDNQAENPRAVIGGNNPPIGEVLADRYAAVQAELELVAQEANGAPRVVESDTAQAELGRIVIRARKLKASLESSRKEEKQPYLDAGQAVDQFFGALKDRLDRIADTLQARGDEWAERKAAAAREQAEVERRRREAEAEELRQKAEAARARGRHTEADRKEVQAEAMEETAEAIGAAADASPADLVRSRAGGITTSATEKWDFTIENYQAIPLDRLRDFIPRKDIEKAVRALVARQKGDTDIPGVKVFPKTKATFRG